MEHAHVDDSSTQVLRAGYRDHTPWFNTVFMLAIVGSRAVLAPHSLVVSISLMVWAIGLALIVVNGVLYALRSERGLTLEADGITWHRAELFIPWSRVTAVELGAGTKQHREQYLIVRTVDPAEALFGQRGLAKLGIQANIQQFGGPIAVKARLLAVPSETVIAAADRFRHAPIRLADPAQDARRARALRFANFWAFAGFAGLLAGLATILLRNLT